MTWCFFIGLLMIIFIVLCLFCRTQASNPTRVWGDVLQRWSGSDHSRPRALLWTLLPDLQRNTCAAKLRQPTSAGTHHIRPDRLLRRISGYVHESHLASPLCLVSLSVLVPWLEWIWPYYSYQRHSSSVGAGVGSFLPSHARQGGVASGTPR